MPARHGVVAAFLVALALAPATVHAQESSVEDAREHFERAVTLFEAGDAAAALPEFQRAYDLSHRASLLFNLAATHEALGDLPGAAEALGRFLAADDGHNRRRTAEARRTFAALVRRVARLRVLREPADVAVQVDGRSLEAPSVMLPPGAHVVVGARDGFVTQRVELVLAAGVEREIRVSLLPQPAPEPPPLVVPAVALPESEPAPPPVVVAPPVAAPPPPDPLRPAAAVVEGWRRRRAAMLTLGIGGGFLTLGGAVAGVLTALVHADYVSRTVDDPQAAPLASRGHALAVTADVLGAVGVASCAAAAVIAVAHDSSSTSRARVVLAPVPGGVTVAGTF